MKAFRSLLLFLVLLLVIGDYQLRALDVLGRLCNGPLVNRESFRGCNQNVSCNYGGQRKMIHKEEAMRNENLESVARKLVAPGKGILAADESSPTIEKRLKSISVPS